MNRLAAKLLKARGETVYKAIGVVALLSGWQLLSMVVHKAIVASPIATVEALTQLVAEGEIWKELWITLRRLLIGLSLASILGLSLGVAAGLRPKFRSFLEPTRWVGMTLPAVVIAVLGMMWFGMGDNQVIFLITIIITPIIYVNTVEGILAVDERIIEMGQVYQFPKTLLLTEIYLPGIGSSVMAGLTLATGIGVRAVILAELMGAFHGIGHSFFRAWNFLNTPELFAWVLTCLALMGILEFGILGPVRKRLMRWKEEVE